MEPVNIVRVDCNILQGLNPLINFLIDVVTPGRPETIARVPYLAPEKACLTVEDVGLLLWPSTNSA